MPTIIPNDAHDAARIARELLEASGGDETRFHPVTHGPHLAFEVDDDLAAAISGTAPPLNDEQGADDAKVIPEPPDRNDTTEAWATYLSGEPFNANTEGKKRSELIAAYDAWLKAADE